MKDEIRNPKVLRKINDLKSSGSSWSAIKEKLKSDMDIEASIPTIRKAYDTYSARSAETIANDGELQQSIREAVLNTSQQLQNINDFANKIIKYASNQMDNLQSDKDISNVMQAGTQAAKQILNQIQFQERLVRQLSEGFDSKEVSKIEYNKIFTNNLQELEKSGYIKILRNPDEPADAEQEIRFEQLDLTDEEAKKLFVTGRTRHENYIITSPRYENQNKQQQNQKIGSCLYIKG